MLSNNSGSATVAGSNAVSAAGAGVSGQHTTVGGNVYNTKIVAPNLNSSVNQCVSFFLIPFAFPYSCSCLILSALKIL